MRNAAPWFGGVLLLIGIIWVLQGINVLPGSFMTGQLFWAFAGAVCIIAGGLMIFAGLGGRRT